ncbi:MAG: hypothetical protein OMM_13902 [Candidatus Magnetoglobus multicellularis str. Araruama]|uniref:Uncharacterized protein n=1 Tax=Candidatus Magnetoglobus multicellularis str. Araruama TaxID=890399 RepID=A0A1V1NST4_9BACT|nr:MAG: hypothetical protein OMM_13902 [Candidatus Magnetoglobus multicellularis str. Araruama]
MVNWIKRNELIAQKIGIDIANLNEKHLYVALGDLDNLQKKIEHKWGIYHKKKLKSIYLYDITSFYFEGTENELSKKDMIETKRRGIKILLRQG